VSSGRKTLAIAAPLHVATRSKAYLSQQKHVQSPPPIDPVVFPRLLDSNTSGGAATTQTTATSTPTTTTTPSNTPGGAPNNTSGGAQGSAQSQPVKAGNLSKTARKGAKCNISKTPKPNMAGFDTFKGFRGETQTVGEEIIKATKKGSEPPFLMYGAMTLMMVPPIMVPLALLPLVLVCWFFGSCKVLTRKCRRCCCCCRERKQVGKVKKCKKCWILVASIIGFGGMIGLAQSNALGPLDEGPKSAENAICAANKFADVALNGATPATDFIGFGVAVDRFSSLQKHFQDASKAGVQVLADNSVKQASDQLVASLEHMKSNLGSQSQVDGHQCEFCNSCCGSAGSVSGILQSLNTGLSSQINSVRARLGSGGTLDSASAGSTKAHTILLDLDTSVQLGPAAGMIFGAEFFDNAQIPLVAMANVMGAQPGSAVGLLAMVYAFHWCCCLRRCRCGQKDHPAPQCVALGWCSGCLAALLGLALGSFSWIVGGVSGEICMFMDDLSSQSGLKTYGNKLGIHNHSTNASLQCFGAKATNRDVYQTLGIGSSLSAANSLSADVIAVRAGSFSSVLNQLTQLQQAAQTTASQFTPAWTNTTDMAYNCAGLGQTAAPCDYTDFVQHQRDLAQQALTAGQTLNTRWQSAATGTTWTNLGQALQAVRAQDLSSVQSGLNCSLVYTRWESLHDQVCGGIVNGYWAAGQAWTAMGLLGFIGACAQYKLWRQLRDNRSLYFDSHPEKRTRGIRRLCSPCCATGIGDGDGDDDDAGEVETAEANDQASGGGRRCCCCRRRGESVSPETPAEHGGEKHVKGMAHHKKAAADPAAERIAAKFMVAYDLSVEEAVKGFLESSLYPDYDGAFLSVAAAERLAAWKTYDRERKSRKNEKELSPPTEPPLGDPAHMFAEGYSDFDDSGVPKSDADGNPLDKKTYNRLKKDYIPVKKQWDKYLEDQRKYQMWLLNRARREVLEEGAEVIYPEEIESLRPLSSKTGLHMG